MKYLYGPVPSRRLGRSLGIDPLPSKTCNYQCIYCQLGRTNNFTNTRKNYYPKQEIYSELEDGIIKNKGKFDFITFVGSGEPLLYKDLGDLISKAKDLSNKPVCVITNGSILYKEEIQMELIDSHLDVILPTLDAGNEKTFIKVNRPHPSINYDKMLNGLVNFNKRFPGKFWLEVMLVEGVNDTKADLIQIKEKIELLNPDRIDINVPIRPPAEDWVKIPDKSVYDLIKSIFGDVSNINFPEKGKFSTHSEDFELELLKIIERHPMSEEQIIETFISEKFPKRIILQKLSELERKKIIKKTLYQEKIFWKLM
jgi:wyosine [tRNA(Phe)-imidazoG37] synthetase (radical SAM superfamily)